MDWVPIVFITFKVLVFGTGMFFAIKWHYDQGKKAKDDASKRQGLMERTPGALEYSLISGDGLGCISPTTCESPQPRGPALPKSSTDRTTVL